MLYLYEVTLKRGKSNASFPKFFVNVSSLNAKAPDRAGIGAICILSHTQPAETVHVLCTDGFKNTSDVTVTEITRKTLKAGGDHAAYFNLANDYFLPYGKYPHVE